jgi:molybdopterin converting factor small subunit
MPTVKFTYALKRFFPGIKDMPTEGATLSEVLEEVNDHYPGLKSYVLDEQGALRKHVNIFIDNQLIADRSHLSDAFGAQSEIYIMQALSGG